jgi:hypothetical protein
VSGINGFLFDATIVPFNFVGFDSVFPKLFEKYFILHFEFDFSKLALEKIAQSKGFNIPQKLRRQMLTRALTERRGSW